MEHPLIGDISSLTDDELLQKINELHRKLGMAQRMGTGHVAQQIRMAIETYQNQYQTRMRSRDNESKNFDNIIDIQ